MTPTPETGRTSKTRAPFAIRAALAAPIVLCSVVLFGRALFGNAAFYARDVLHFYWPLRSTAASLIRTFELPQWSAFSQAGLPFLADIHAGTLYPLHLLYQFLSFPRAYAWLLFLHHVAGGLGALTFFRQLQIRRLPSLCGALVFMFSGYVVGLTNAGPLMGGAACVPWVLAALTSPLRPHLKVPLLGLVLAIQILGGDVQAVLFSGLCAAVLVLWQKERGSLALTLVAGLALAALVTAVQLVPAWHLLGQSNRAAANPQFISEFSFHPARLLELFAPFPFGAYLVKDSFWASFAVNGPGIWPFALSGYLGASSATLAIAGVTKDRRAGLGLTLLFFGLFLALGQFGPFSFLLLHAPFRFFRYPEKYLLVASLGMATLVALGANQVCTGCLSRRRLWGIGIGVGALAAAAAVGHVGRSSFEHVVGRMLEGFAIRVSASTAVSTALQSARSALLFAASTCVLMLVSIAGRRSHRLAVPALAVVIGFDLMLAAQRLIFTAPIELYQSRPAIVDRLGSSAPSHPFRYLRDPSLSRTFDRSSEESYLGFRTWELATLRSNVAGSFDMEEVTGYGGAFSLKRWQAVAVALGEQPGKMAAIFNGCFALTTVASNPYERSESFKRAAFDSALGLAVYQTTFCQPRLRAILHAVSAKNLDEAVRTISAAGFDLASEAAIEGGREQSFAPAQIEDVRFESRRAFAKVRAPSGGTMVLFGTSYYPGWTARVDDRAVPLQIVNGATMGAAVPEGAHSLEFEFNDPGLRPGLALSCLGLLLAVGWAIGGRAR